jgi:hypothetical protein
VSRTYHHQRILCIQRAVIADVVFQMDLVVAKLHIQECVFANLSDEASRVRIQCHEAGELLGNGFGRLTHTRRMQDSVASEIADRIRFRQMIHVLDQRTRAR